MSKEIELNENKEETIHEIKDALMAGYEKIVITYEEGKEMAELEDQILDQLPFTILQSGLVQFKQNSPTEEKGEGRKAYDSKSDNTEAQEPTLNEGDLNFESKFQKVFNYFYKYQKGSTEEALENLREFLFDEPYFESARNFLNKIVLGKKPDELSNIGVIMPVYISVENEKKGKVYLLNAIDSLLLQNTQVTYTIYLINDCNEVDLRSFIEAMYVDLLAGVLTENGDFKENINANGNIFLVDLQEPSGGPGHPRNVGYWIAMQEYEYLSHFDCDDIAEKNRLAVLYNALKHHPEVHAVHAKHVSIDSENNLMEKEGNHTDRWFTWCREWTLGLDEQSEDSNGYVKHDDIMKEELIEEGQNFIHNQTTMVRSAFLKDNLKNMFYFPEKGDYFEDLEFWKKVNKYGEMMYIDVTVARYRQHEYSITNS